MKYLWILILLPFSFEALAQNEPLKINLSDSTGNHNSCDFSEIQKNSGDTLEFRYWFDFSCGDDGGENRYWLEFKTNHADSIINTMVDLKENSHLMKRLFRNYSVSHQVSEKLAYKGHIQLKERSKKKIQFKIDLLIFDKVSNRQYLFSEQRLIRTGKRKRYTSSW
ncbi:MAG: hypothetical protein MK105_18070 [Crocinitomicaceae bacterium]|nr:hypothetical protein [Crocinitomicaceae bacterium]